MTRIAIGLLLSLPAGLLTSVAAAQDPQEPQGCQSLSSASRTRARQCSQEEEPEQESEEPVVQEFTLNLDTHPLETALCRATLNIEYLQSNTTARVSGVIDNKDCAASSGEYTIQARIRDESGATETLEFVEPWQRDDDQPVSFTSEYPIGDNVQLLRVRSSGLQCECAAPEEEQPPATAQ